MISMWFRDIYPFGVVQSRLWPGLLPFIYQYMLYYLDMWYFFPSLVELLLAIYVLSCESARVFASYIFCGKHSLVVDRLLQTVSEVTFEDVAIFGECCAVGHNLSLNIYVLDFSLMMLYRCPKYS